MTGGPPAVSALGPPEDLGFDADWWTPRGLLAVTYPVAADYLVVPLELVVCDPALRVVARRACGLALGALAAAATAGSCGRARPRGRAG